MKIIVDQLRCNVFNVAYKGAVLFLFISRSNTNRHLHEASSVPDLDP